jgi:1,4-dihydroxy-2-naphthoate octaprenyltransferase
MASTNGHPGLVRTWLLAARPPTLTAAAAPVVVGTAVALRDRVFEPAPAIAALVAALSLQVAANLANDLADFRRGADTGERLGPPRVTQQGLLSERQVFVGATVSFSFAALVGLYLIAVGGWPVIAIGVASILAAITYTGGPWPFGYHGLGELFVFIFFGVVAVTGTYFVQAGHVSDAAVAASVPVGLTVTAILVVNNVRDIETDRAAGKNTLAVYLGRRAARYQYLVTVAGAYVAVIALWVGGGFSSPALIALLSAPLAIAPVRAVLTSIEGPPLNEALRATARLHFVFGALLAIGLVI